MSNIYPRTELATQMAKQLIHPGVLDEGLRSGLFLSGLRRTGKTTFLLNDLIPALEREGALVIYVDLWSDTQASPADLVLAAIRKTMEELQAPGSILLSKLTRVSGVDIGILSFKFGFKLESVGKPGGTTLAQAFTDLVDQAKTDVVLIVDEVQHAITTDDGNQMLLGLKAARDAINPRPLTPGHFIFIGTGSHRALVSELTARRSQAFAGATSIPFPVLDEGYVRQLINRLDNDGVAILPSPEVAIEAFRSLGSRPEEIIKAIRQLQLHLPNGSNPDDYLPVIAATLRSTAADIELSKVEQLGGLAVTIFERIAASDGDAKGIFSADAAADYSKAVGREVRVEEIQPVVNELMAANIIMRRGHGLYGITDPFVQEIWREKIKFKG
ncbi:AAA family ATPase [Collimonas humicola]|uniref:AAA family ATPase n=1 Tax=Collimonas humicola TaxID=2825886 RepID=UPI001B8CA3E8|nr:AAA family ATPase [Collimonas humicola]